MSTTDKLTLIISSISLVISLVTLGFALRNGLDQ